jgi:hypothetical protein
MKSMKRLEMERNIEYVALAWHMHGEAWIYGQMYYHLDGPAKFLT